MGSHFYIAMFTIDHIMFKIGGQEIITPLINCKGFEMTNTPIIYDGTIPTLECNVTFGDIKVYSEIPDSTFDLTLIHHFRSDWNQTNIKLESKFDFNNTKFYNGTEFNAGEHFTAEIHYVMQLTDPGLVEDNTIQPSGITNTTLEYNLAGESSSSYTLSKLEMNDTFTVHNASGDYSATGYSSMGMNNLTVINNSYNPKSALVTHGFPNLIYKEIQWMRSDPELWICHDRVTGHIDTMRLILGVVVSVCIAAGVIAGVLLIRKHYPRQNIRSNG